MGVKGVNNSRSRQLEILQIFELPKIQAVVCTSLLARNVRTMDNADIQAVLVKKERILEG